MLQIDNPEHLYQIIGQLQGSLKGIREDMTASKEQHMETAVKICGMERDIKVLREQMPSVVDTVDDYKKNKHKAVGAASLATVMAAISALCSFFGIPVPDSWGP